MLYNFFRIAFRNFKKDKISSVINITGLAVGITCFITLTLFILDEMGYDNYNKNADQIYRVYVKASINNVNQTNSKTSGSLGPVLAQNFPEVIKYTRIGYYGPRAFIFKENVFRTGSIYAVDSTFFSVFTLPFISGDPATALIHPNSLVLTETAAKRFFGDENPLGKTLSIENGKDFIVTGVMKDFPKNSHFSCQILESMTTYDVNKNWLDLWYSTYIVMKKGTDIREFEKKLGNVVTDYVGPEAEALLGVPIKEFLSQNNEYGFFLQPLTSIYLYSQGEYGIDLNTEWGDVKTSDIAYTYIFSVVAVFMLLIAIINFMNLATARSERRAKEVGIRKTLGSSKTKLITQFISEAMIMSLFSVLISLALLEIVLPLFNNLVGRDLKLDLFANIYTIPLMIGFVLFVGIVAGSYPAFYLSSFRPAHVLKSDSAGGGRKSFVRSGLVIIQFAVSISLLIGTIIINNQLNFIQNKNLGFKKDHLLSVNNVSMLGGRMDAFKQELTKNPNILSLTSASLMFAPGIPGSGYLFNKKTGTDPILCQFLDVDYDYIKTFQIGLQSGRFFSKDFSTDSQAVIVNEATVKMFHTDDPVGKKLTSLDSKEIGKSYKIIGVIKDFNYESLHTQVRPLVLHLSKVRQPANILTMRISSANMKNTIGYIEDTWKKFAGSEVMSYRFVDETLARLYDSEEKTSIVATVFSVLAIFIACLGLFGLAAFVTEQRTKEIGIRKVMGASVFEILTLLSKEFTKWVVLANIIAWPIAFYVIYNWLGNFAYRTEISLWAFILSGASALLIALLTVCFHAIRIAIANPVNSLRHE